MENKFKRVALQFLPILIMSSASKKPQGKKKYTLVSDQATKIGATWLNEKVWDQPLIEKFYSLLKEREDHFVVCDIGAQTGCFTLLAKYFPNSTWYAFEPIYEAANALKTNLALNDIKTVSVHQVALSDKKGLGYLRLPKDTHWGLATLGGSPVRFKKADI